MENLINSLSTKLRSMEEVNDVEFFRAIQEINANYIILAPTKKSTNFANNINSVLGYDFKYVHFKLPIGMTFEELYIKALAFHSKDPEKYVKQNCILIPKNEKVMDYLDSVKLISKLTGEEDQSLSSTRMKLLTGKFDERIFKEFLKRFKLMLPENYTIRTYDTPTFKNGYCLLEVNGSVPGTEEEQKDRFISDDNSPSYNDLEKTIKELSLNVFDKELKIKRHTAINLSMKLIDGYDGETIYRDSNLLYKRDRKSRARKNNNFGSSVGVILTYNQYCDIALREIKRGELIK